MEMRSTRAAPYLLSLILLLASQRLGGGSCALVNPQGDEFSWKFAKADYKTIFLPRYL
jgi:hypothetical protein